MKRIIFINTSYVLLLISLLSCGVEPQKINYGKDHCYNCDMTIVDKTHAAEYVTKKGKSRVFDAIECLIMKLEEKQNEDLMTYILVTDFSNPGTLIEAKTATYLISEKIKSPMGANLSAFRNKETAEKTKQENGNEIYTWEEIKGKYKK